MIPPTAPRRGWRDSDAKHSVNSAPPLKRRVRRSGLKDGMTISFHHAFREGDRVDQHRRGAAGADGLQNLTLASSSLMTCNDALIEHIAAG